MLLEPLNGFEAMAQPFKRRRVFGVAAGPGKSQEQDVLPLVFWCVRVVSRGRDLFAREFCLVLGCSEHDEVAVPLVEEPEHRLGHHRDSEAFMARRFDQPFARKPVQRIADRSYAGIELVREQRWLEPVARSVQPLAQTLLDRSIDALERARRSHCQPQPAAAGHSCPRKNSARSCSWSGRNASAAPRRSGGCPRSRTEGH